MLCEKKNWMGNSAGYIPHFEVKIAWHIKSSDKCGSKSHNHFYGKHQTTAALMLPVTAFPIDIRGIFISHCNCYVNIPKYHFAHLCFVIIVVTRVTPRS